MEVQEFINLDLENIITPVKPLVLRSWLEETKYDPKKIEYLVHGFSHGFELGYSGKLKDCKRLAPNLKLRIGNKYELWNKVMKEVKLGSYAGPFEQPPFEFLFNPLLGWCLRIKEQKQD